MRTVSSGPIAEISLVFDASASDDPLTPIERCDFSSGELHDLHGRILASLEAENPVNRRGHVLNMIFEQSAALRAVREDWRIISELPTHLQSDGAIVAAAREQIWEGVTTDIEFFTTLPVILQRDPMTFIGALTQPMKLMGLATLNLEALPELRQRILAPVIIESPTHTRKLALDMILKYNEALIGVEANWKHIRQLPEYLQSDTSIIAAARKQVIRDVISDPISFDTLPAVLQNDDTIFSKALTGAMRVVGKLPRVFISLPRSLQTPQVYAVAKQAILRKIAVDPAYFSTLPACFQGDDEIFLASIPEDRKLSLKKLITYQLQSTIERETRGKDPTLQQRVTQVFEAFGKWLLVQIFREEIRESFAGQLDRYRLTYVCHPKGLEQLQSFHGGGRLGGGQSTLIILVTKNGFRIVD